MNESSIKRLAAVHPLLREKILELERICRARGIEIAVVQGLRTFAEQDALFAKGRTKPGKRVTNARGGQSNHNFGLAVDLAPIKDGEILWDDEAPFRTIGRCAVTLGLEWGGDWKSFVDLPHVQIPGPSVAECLALYRKGGIKAVWEETDRRLRPPVL